MKYFVYFVLATLLGLTMACTNYLVTPGASADGSSIISYAADSHVLYGELYHYPAGVHPSGTMRDIYDWDSGKYMGQIKEAPITYNVIGNMNEWQLTIAETTYGGLPDLLEQPGAIIDYGSLIYVTLQRARNAREAIETMANLTSEYGYASEGESFSIADPNEVWIMDLIGKGAGEKGAVWVARKIPDGYISGHANQARIQTFPLNDTNNCVYAPDVISFARRKGYYPAGQPDDKFSFSDVYDPLTFGGARFCEIRVWSFFRHVLGDEWSKQYEQYVRGIDLKHRMPLWIQPPKKVSVHDVMTYMRDHLEETWFDMTKDLGAEPFGLPYRWRPLTWTVEGIEYCNERATGTQQTGWSFVSQMRKWMPREIGGILWFGVDDTATTVWAPMYCSITNNPDTYKKGDIMKMDFNSAFWAFNLVANWAYSRYNLMYPEIREKIENLEQQYFNEIVSVDKQALALYQQDKQKAIDYLTSYSTKTGDDLTQTWIEYFKFLFVKYLDGDVKYPNPDPSSKLPIVKSPGYNPNWLKRIVVETGDHFRVYGQANRMGTQKKLKIVNK